MFDEQVYLQFNKFAKGGVAITSNSIEDGLPYGRHSVWIEGLASDEVAIKNYSEGEGTLDILIRAGVISEPIRYITSGYIRIPVCKLLKRE